MTPTKLRSVGLGVPPGLREVLHTVSHEHVTGVFQRQLHDLQLVGTEEVLDLFQSSVTSFVIIETQNHCLVVLDPLQLFADPRL